MASNIGCTGVAICAVGVVGAVGVVDGVGADSAGFVSVSACFISVCVVGVGVGVDVGVVVVVVSCFWVVVALMCSLLALIFLKVLLPTPMLSWCSMILSRYIPSMILTFSLNYSTFLALSPCEPLP